MRALEAILDYMVYFGGGYGQVYACRHWFVFVVNNIFMVFVWVYQCQMFQTRVNGLKTAAEGLILQWGDLRDTRVLPLKTR